MKCQNPKSKCQINACPHRLPARSATSWQAGAKALQAGQMNKCQIYHLDFDIQALTLGFLLEIRNLELEISIITFSTTFFIGVLSYEIF